MDDKIKNSLLGRILNIFKIETTMQNDLIYNKTNNPKFFFLKFTRTIFIERLTRLFDID